MSDCKVYLDRESAYRIWFSELRATYNRRKFRSADMLIDCPSSAKELKGVINELEKQHPELLGEDLHLMVPDPGFRVGQTQAGYSVQPEELVPGSFVMLDDGIGVASPAFTLVQMSERLSRPHLAMAIDEACGTYVMLPGNGESFIDDLHPLCTKSEIARIAMAYAGRYKTKTLMRILPRCAEGAASPRETETQLLLNLTTRDGGCGIPTFEMNVPLQVPGEFQSYLQQRRVTPDIFDAGSRLDIEYMSWENHHTPEEIEHDKRRRRVIEAMGYTVVEVRPQHLRSAAAFEPIAASVKEHLDIKVHKETPGFQSKRWNLMQGLEVKTLP